MKPFIFCLALTIFCFSGIRAQAVHIPTNHQHRTSGNGACYGYAMGRSGNKSETDICNPAKLVLPYPYSPDDANANLAWNVDEAYWTKVNGATLSGVAIGDIIAFGSSHVSYVRNVTSNQNGGYDIRIDDIIGFGSEVNQNVTLERVNYGGGLYHYKRNSGITAEASSYFERKEFPVVAKNRYGSNGQDVYTQGTITIGYNGGTSPFTKNKDWAYSTYVQADAGQQYPTGYPQIFQYFILPDQTHVTSNPLNITVTNSESQNTYVAYHLKQYNITFENDMPSLGNVGAIIINSLQYNLPQSPFIVYEQSPPQGISAQALYQNINRIDYTFRFWTNNKNSDTVWSASTTFYPTDHTTYAAHFNPKPLPPDNIYPGGQVGNPVQISWTMHPSAYVTEYQIWRKIKPKYGQDGNPVLLSTFGRTTTSYTDWDYYVTSGYTDDLVYYDVRSHFVCSPWNVYSDVNWSGGIFGTDYGKSPEDGNLSITRAGIPIEYSIGAYPNPFNPSTTISFQLLEDADVTLAVFDINGKRTASLIEGTRSAGYHRLVWDAKGEGGTMLASGIYFYRFVARPLNGKELFQRSGKLILMK